MKILVLGSSGSDLPGLHLPALLIDGFILLDAGTIGSVLDIAAQKKIRYILITHAHFDHIRGLPSFADNIINCKYKYGTTILSGRDVLNEIKAHIFNNKIWPDFTSIPDKKNPVIKFRGISSRSCAQINNYRIYTTRVDHSVAAYGYIIENPKGHALVYTGDTGPTARLWRKMSNHDVKALITEITFPDSMNKLALLTGHLTPSLLAEELKKMNRVPEKIYISHVKPQYRHVIQRELKKLHAPSIEILNNHSVISV